MPEISRFYGIIIALYYDDHNPPHFHARYNEYKIAINIDNLSVIEGSLPPKAMGLVVEWAVNHQIELKENWELIKQGKIPNSIEPL